MPVFRDPPFSEHRAAPQRRCCVRRAWPRGCRGARAILALVLGAGGSIGIGVSVGIGPATPAVAQPAPAPPAPAQRATAAEQAEAQAAYDKALRAFKAV